MTVAAPPGQAAPFYIRKGEKIGKCILTAAGENSV